MHLTKDSFALRGEVKWIKSKNGVIIAESDWCPNKVLSGSNLGVSMLLDRLAGITTYTGTITHADIGDDDTPATAADTGLGNALARSTVKLKSRSGLSTDYRFFYPDATTPDDTYKEFGMVVDGNATVGTGQYFNHLVMSDLVKASGEDHTIVCRLTASV